MPKYLVSYDLANNGNYEGLYNLLNSHERSMPITESAWCVVTDETDEDMLACLNSALDSDDELIIFHLTGNWAGVNALDEKLDWRWQHLGGKQ